MSMVLGSTRPLQLQGSWGLEMAVVAVVAVDVTGVTAGVVGTAGVLLLLLLLLPAVDVTGATSGAPDVTTAGMFCAAAFCCCCWGARAGPSPPPVRLSTYTMARRTQMPTHMGIRSLTS